MLLVAKHNQPPKIQLNYDYDRSILCKNFVLTKKMIYLQSIKLLASMRISLCYMLLLMIVGITPLLAQNPLVLKDKGESYELNPYLTVLEDTSKKIQFEQLYQPSYQQRFKPFTKKVLSFGNSRSAFWLQFKVNNMTEERWVIAVERGYIDSLSFYQVDSQHNVVIKHVGLVLPKENRDYNINYFAFQLNIPQDSTATVYLRVASNKTMALPISIYTESTLVEMNGYQKWYNGLFFGGLLLLILYNLGTFIAVRERIYLLYIIYTFCLATQLATLGGFSYEHIFHKFLNINYYATVVYILPPIAYTFFLIQFLGLNAKKTMLYIQYCFIGVYVLLLIVGVATLFHPTMISVLRLVVFIHSFTIVTMAAIRWRQGFAPAKYFFVAATGFLCMVLVVIIRDLGFLPINPFTLYATQIGGIWDTTFLSFALAERIYELRKGKQQAELEALKAIDAHAKLVEEQNRILEEKVEERTKELRDANQEIEVQNEELKQQQEELLAINDALEKQKKTIEEQNKQLELTFTQLKQTSDRLNASIRYAQNIQQVVLPNNDELLTFFPSFFAIYLPKDIVSGDFYWFKQLGRIAEKNEMMTDKEQRILATIKQRLILDLGEEDQPTKSSLLPTQGHTYDRAMLIVADCTGHGVPGAFMTMVGNTLLHEIIEHSNMTNPAQVLQFLHLAIVEILHQEAGQNSDGMDIAVCLFERNIETEQVRLTFAGAKSSIYYTDGENVTRLVGDKMFVGGKTSKARIFENQQILLPKGEKVYLQTDGFADQNNSQRDSLGIKNYQHLLGTIQEFPLDEQKNMLLQSLQQHQGYEPQRDDITVVGVEI